MIDLDAPALAKLAAEMRARAEEVDCRDWSFSDEDGYGSTNIWDKHGRICTIIGDSAQTIAKAEHIGIASPSNVLTILDALDAADARMKELGDAAIERFDKLNARIVELAGERESAHVEIEHWTKRVFVDASAHPPVSWEERAGELAGELEEARTIERRLATTVRFSEARESGVREDRERLTAELEAMRHENAVLRAADGKNARSRRHIMRSTGFSEDKALTAIRGKYEATRQELDRTEQRRLETVARATAAEARAAKLRETVDRLCDAIRWALGETDFRPREDGEPPYWWRTELRQKSGLQWDPEMKRSVLAAAERARAVAEAQQS